MQQACRYGRRCKLGVLITMFFVVSASGFTIYPAGHLATAVELNQSYFDFSQYTLYAKGVVEITPQAHVELGIDYRPNEPIIPVAWADYTFIQAFRIQIGRFPIPFGAFNELVNPTNNALVTIPDICINAIPTPWLDWGARLQWMQRLNDWEVFTLSAYLCNGLGDGESLRDSRQMNDNNQSNAFGARIAVISPRFGEFGASGYFGARDDEGDQNLGLFGLDIRTKISFVELRGEYVAGLLSFPAGTFAAIEEGIDYLKDSSTDSAQSWTCGTYLEAAFRLSQYAIPAIRFDIIGYEDLDSGMRLSRERIGLGFACYPIEALVLKLEFGLLNDRNADEIRLEPLYLQLGISL